MNITAPQSFVSIGDNPVVNAAGNAVDNVIKPSLDAAAGVFEKVAPMWEALASGTRKVAWGGFLLGRTQARAGMELVSQGANKLTGATGDAVKSVGELFQKFQDTIVSTPAGRVASNALNSVGDAMQGAGHALGSAMSAVKNDPKLVFETARDGFANAADFVGDALRNAVTAIRHLGDDDAILKFV